MTVDDSATVRLLKSMRITLIVVAILGIVLGILALVWPGATLLTIALLFGSYLVAAGVFRLFAAITTNSLSGGIRWLLGFFGVLIIVAGVLCLANPFGSLLILAIIIGVGWIMDGLVAIVAGVMGSTARPRWLAVVSGVISIIAGIVILLLPGFALATFTVFGAILLIVISVATLLTLPSHSGSMTRAANQS